MKLTPKEYHLKYCTSCQYIWCDGPFGDRDNNTRFQECTHHEEVMTVEEELVDELYTALKENAEGMYIPIRLAQDVAKVLMKNGWRK